MLLMVLRNWQYNRRLKKQVERQKKLKAAKAQTSKAMTKEEEISFYYNTEWKKYIEDVLAYWEKYLPKHKFMVEQTELGYELKKKLGSGEKL